MAVSGQSAQQVGKDHLKMQGGLDGWLVGWLRWLAGWVGLDWIGLDWIGLDWFGLVWLGGWAGWFLAKLGLYYLFENTC